MRATSMRKRSGRPLGARPWGTTATCTAATTSCCSLTCSRPFGGPAKSSTAWTLLIITPARGSPGRPAQEDRAAYRLRPASVHREGLAWRHLNDLKAPRQTIPWSRGTTQGSQVATSYTSMRTISTVELWVNISPPAASGGWMTASSWQKLSQSNQLTGPRAMYLRWTWSTQKTYTTPTMHIRWHRSAWWFRRNGCWSISTTTSALGRRQQRLRSWSQTSVTRTAMCFTVGICSYTCLWACVWLRSVVLSGTTRARMNTELRKMAASGFEKDLYKLMNNSVFGKTMENLRRAPHRRIYRSAVLRCTQSLRAAGKTSRRQRVWKRMSWKSTSDTSSTKRLSSLTS